MAWSRPLRLIDAHAHVNFRAYKDDGDQVIRRSLEQGIGVINVGSQASSSERAVEYAERFDGVWAVVGLHPIHLIEQPADEFELGLVTRSEKFDPNFYRALARRTPKVVGLGECGLDYYHFPEGIDHAAAVAEQKRVFRAHLDLAAELNLAVMIHARDPQAGPGDAHADILAILEEAAAAGQRLRGDAHCFSGTWTQAERYLNLGFYLSVTGNVTYKPRAAERAAGWTVADLVRRVPLDRLLVETDSPYLTPVPHRGERNEPAHVAFVAAKIAEILGRPAEEVERQTLKNTLELFRL